MSLFWQIYIYLMNHWGDRVVTLFKSSKAPQCSSVAGYVRQLQDTRARLIDETRYLRAYVYLGILYTRYKIPFQMFSEIPS